MQAYVDDSMADGKILVFGGLISTAEKWNFFSVEWQRYLKGNDIRVFKMRTTGNRHARQLYRLLCEHVVGSICFTVPVDAVKEVAGDYKHTEIFGPEISNHYWWAYRGIMDVLVQEQQRWGLSAPVDFIFDDQSNEEQKSGVIMGWNIFRQTISPKYRSFIGSPPVFANDEQTLPLQAADMWAWFCRKAWLKHGGTIPVDSYPIPWGKVGDIPQLIAQLSRDDIDENISRMLKNYEKVRHTT